MKVRATILGLALGACALAGGACVTPGADVHLAPFYSRFTAADGAVETEALFGLFQRRVGGVRRLHGDDELARSRTTVGPLWSLDREPGLDSDPGAVFEWRSRFLVPLGFAHERSDEAQAVLAPVFLWQSGPRLDGSHESRLITIWGWIWRDNDVHGKSLDWFPFYGDLENFLLFDRLQFLLWPLWTYVEADGSVGRHLLMPVFGWTRGEGKNATRFWPLFGHSWHTGNYDRWFFLWPFFHHHRNRLGFERSERKWLIFPLVGRTTSGSYAATTLLWPFFGFAADRENGFWALDLPWPLIRIQRGPGETTRTRFWPLFSHLRSSGLDAWSFAWPIIHLRRERGQSLERDSLYVVPLWQSWNARRPGKQAGEGRESSWRKLFPVFQYETQDDWRRGSFPTLDPFGRNELIERHYAWLWKLWEWEAQGERRHERSWGGIVRREQNALESRTSFSGLWARRRAGEGEQTVSEHSILFGLLRWRVTEEAGFDMLPPAFPGPGWSPEWGADDGPLPVQAP